MIVTTHLKRDGVVELALSGELDGVTATAVRRIGLEAIQTNGCRRFLVDLGEVCFIDSSGLSALIAFRNAADDRGLSFALLDPSARTMRVLAITGLSDIFTIERT